MVAFPVFKVFLHMSDALSSEYKIEIALPAVFNIFVFKISYLELRSITS